MRARLTVLSLVLVPGLLLAACSSQGDSKTVDSGNAPAGLINSGKLTTCTDASFPPMESVDPKSGDVVGFDADVISMVAKAWGVEPNIKVMAFDGLLPGLETEKCDVVWSGIYVTPERLATFPAVSYLKTGTVALVRSGNPAGITDDNSLAGKTLAVQSGTSLVKVGRDLAKRVEDAGLKKPRVQLYPNATDLIQQLTLGRADAILTADTEAAYRQSENPGKFEVGYAFDDKLTMGVYFKRSNAELGQDLFKALTDLKQSGELATEAKKYFLSPENIEITMAEK